MEINLWAVLAATIAMFAVGAFWYMVPFAKKWGEIHGFDKLTPKQQKDLQAETGPLYVIQLIVTIISAFVLVWLIAKLPGENPYIVAGMIWLGFVLPAQASAVIFGGSDPKWAKQKLAIMAGESLLHLQVATLVISIIM